MIQTKWVWDWMNAQADALTVALDSGMKCRRVNTTGYGLVQRPLPAANQNNRYRNAGGSAPAIQSPKPFQEVHMTVITYGTSIRSNAKTRRHERRRAAAIERDTIGNIIDSILGLSAQDEPQEELRKVASRVDKAVNGTLSLRSKREESGSACLPEVSLYNAGHRKSENVTAR